jgi:hypothetical protein
MLPSMERAPLRPVPARPAGPVDPDEAVRHVAARLPGLDEPAATALALVALVGTTRPAASGAAGLAPAEIGDALARARKALRRSMFPLPGSGWCERAERQVSDRLDDALEPPGPARLEVHLRNCPRCVEHERRLVQATDVLVASFPRPLAKPGVPAAAGAVPPLSVIGPKEPAGPAVRPFGEPVRPAPARVRPPRPVQERTVESPVAGRQLPGLARSVLIALAVLLVVLGVVIAALGATGTQL